VELEEGRGGGRGGGRDGEGGGEGCGDGFEVLCYCVLARIAVLF